MEFLFLKEKIMKVYYKGEDVEISIDRYLSLLKSEYRKNYDKNRKNIIIKLSDHGFYYFDGQIYFNNAWVLVHELMHMASYDQDRDTDGLCDELDNGVGLNEGMTEYLTMDILGEDMPSSYFLEVFCTQMLLMIKDYRGSYLTSNRMEFLDTFRDVSRLSLLVDSYYKEYNNYKRELDSSIEDLVEEILSCLINIAILMLDDDEFANWVDKFNDLYDMYATRFKLFRSGRIKRRIKTKKGIFDR